MLEISAETDTELEKPLLETKKTESNISYSDIAIKLLDDRLLLTALELHCELTEAGKEIPKLKEFFSNPGNFEQNSRIEVSSTGLTRWSSQATLDSLDMTRYSEDGEKILDDRVAVLEFELRKAKETINALRTNLTVATECETVSQNVSNSSKTCASEPIKPHEQRALNFLINEYLLLHGYKLTSITFADENENQDFEVWDDVGLNIPKPPELLHLYRESMKNSHILNTTYQTASMQTDGDVEEIELLISQFSQLKDRISELEFENKVLTEDNERLKEQKVQEEITVETIDLETVNSHFAAPTSDSGSIPDHFIIVESCQEASNSDNTEIVDDNSATDRLNESPEWPRLKKTQRGTTEINAPCLTNKKKQKFLKDHGRGYMSHRGHFVPPKQPPSRERICRCSFDCAQLTYRMKLRAFTSFYDLSYEEQNILLTKSFTFCPIRRRVTKQNPSRRQQSFTYFVNIGRRSIKVCLKTLCNVYRVSTERIKILKQKVRDGRPMTDGRGFRDAPRNKMADEIKEIIMAHASAIVEEHLQNGTINKLNVKKMYLEFVANHPEIQCSRETYRKLCKLVLGQFEPSVLSDNCKTIIIELTDDTADE